MNKIDELQLKIDQLTNELDKCDISTLTGFLLAENSYNELLDLRKQLQQIKEESTMNKNSQSKSFNPFKDQREFMKLAGHSTDSLNYEQFLGLYLNLVEEEYKEALSAETYPEMVKELIDLIYVSLGAIHSLGVDSEKAWELVHNNNMLKLKNKPKFNKDGKVKKSEESIKAKEKMMDEIELLVYPNDVKQVIGSPEEGY